MPKLCSNYAQMQTRLHNCWTHKFCAGLDSDIPSEKRSNLSYWIYFALFVLSLNETQKNYTWCMVSLSRDTYLVNTRNHPSLTLQFFVKVLLRSVVQEASVRIGIKGSWRLWFSKWVLYFENVTYHKSGPWGSLAFDTECENMWSRDLGSLLLASNRDSGVLHNCWCLGCCFSVRSTFPQLAMMKIQMIFTELITICPASIHIKIITKLLKLGCRTALQRRWPLWKWLVFVAYLSLAATSKMSEAFSSHIPYQWNLLKFAFLLISILICMRHW